MPRRSIRRFALEVLFLAGVAAAATIAELRPAGVIVLLALAWAVVALLEWTVWLDEPHYGRGLPPRYYVPNTALPPPRAVVQGGARYPTPRSRAPSAADDAPTFVASAAEWSTEIADWTLLDSPGEETVVAAPGELEPDPAPLVPLPPPLASEETVVRAPRPHEEPAEVAAAARVAAAIPAERPDPAELPAPLRIETVALHRVDPLAAPGRRRLRVRRAPEEITVRVPDGPPPDRSIAEQVLEQARAARR
jgi:hypothetical protein